MTTTLHRHKWTLNQGVFSEPLDNGQGLALWLSRSSEKGFQIWERARTIPNTEFIVDGAIKASVASVLSARERLPGFSNRLRELFKTASTDQQWVLPNGGTAEQSGERQDDAMLVWSEDDVRSLDDAWIRAHWPHATSVEHIGLNLYLVTGVLSAAGDQIAQLAQVEGCPRQLAEQALANARHNCDRRGETTALIDLALIEQNQNNLPRCMTLLGEALEVARSLGDPALECDVLSNLGFACLSTGELQRSADLLEQALLLARESGDIFVVKLVLERLGHAYFRLGDAPRCLSALHESLALARSCGDRSHEASLLWLLAILHADWNERDQAIMNGQAAVEVMETSGNLQTPWYAEQLRRYRAGERIQQILPSSAGPPKAAAGQVFVAAGTVSVQPANPSPHPALSQGERGTGGQPIEGPGLLRMALTATTAMAKFLASGLKTVSRSEVERRLRTCAVCPHYTGLRCRVCGCFTNAKARLPYEACPLGKW